ncbi:cell division control protein 42 homolog [Tribolium castaneum]|uniref:Cdc42 homolog-like Protein n=1 Tax=Tribolium castaneum TaxID=7070 RepID=D6X2A6_TRICA|nr:PREDICTED: cell division control protein 42 homolog [Tribolium castaneum]EFA10741.1 Cdc42 homolog-like Protein [Tribolium castaneum]|eukprot:XP_970876.1 PREDICTED: cell division control protein 42 homolog [Tribolium castaneum]
MTPQYSPNLHYTKQPLLTHQTPVIFYNNASKKPKVKKERNNAIKCVIVGDKEVGKTALAVSYSNDTFPSQYVPTAYDNYNVEVQVDGKPIRLELCDTAGEDDFNPLRNLCYPGTDVFMLCFSVVKPTSFLSACTRWADELARYHDAAVVLVGTQSDLQNNTEIIQGLRLRRQRPVRPSEARQLADRLNAPYVETSAKTCQHLKEAFDQAIMLALKKNKKRKPWRKLCCF